MNIQEFKELELKLDESVMIHFAKGTTVHGVYKGNFYNDEGEFDFLDHGNGQSSKINLNEVHSIILVTRPIE